MENRKILFGTVIVAALVLAVAVMAEMTDSQCHQLASNIDKVVLNTNPEEIIEEPPILRTNFCTGEKETSTLYLNQAAPLFGRIVFVNDMGGTDVRGWTTDAGGYVLCGDGRARVEKWNLMYLAIDACDTAYPENPGSPCYGLRHNPVVSWLNYFRMEQCNTID